jgi:hypothetical protein
VVIGDLVQTRGQQSDLDGGDGELSGLFVTRGLLVLGVGTAGETTDTDNVTSSQVDVLLLERSRVRLEVVGLGEDLQSGTVGADVVEE